MLLPLGLDTSRLSRWPRASLAIAALCVLAFLLTERSGAYSRPPERVPFTYERVIASSGPAHGELSRCVGRWESWAATRSRLFGEMQRQGVWRAREVVVLESGSRGWGGYRYALAVDGKSLSGPGGAVLGDVFVGPTEGLRSEIDRNVDDGGCWFLTVVRERQATQVVVSGLIDEAEGEAAQIIKRMLPFAQSPSSDQ